MTGQVVRLLIVYLSLPLLGMGSYAAMIRFYRTFTEATWNLWWGLWDACTIIIVALVGWAVFQAPPQLPTWRLHLYTAALAIGDIGLMGLIWNLRRNIEPKEEK